MSTKEKFLSELREVFDKYKVSFPYKDGNGIPNGTLNNLPNKLIMGFLVTIPNEDVQVCISGTEFIDYMCHIGE